MFLLPGFLNISKKIIEYKEYIETYERFSEVGET